MYIKYLLCLLILLAACSSGIEPGPSLETLAIRTTLRLPLVASSDDAEEMSGVMTLGDGLLELNSRGGVTQTVGLRFQNVTLPPGAKIENAYLEVKGGTRDRGRVTLEVRGEAADNAATYSASEHDLSRRAKTAAAVLWNPGGWVRGRTYRTENLAPVVQEIIDRSGWQRGNALALTVAGVGGNAERTLISHDGRTGFRSVLVVGFSTREDADSGPAPSPTPDSPTSETLNLAVVAGADDVAENAAGVMIAGRALHFARQQVGLRFTNVALPPGAVVTAATISFRTASRDAGAVSLQIRGEAAYSAEVFGGAPNSLSSRAQTLASALWQPKAWRAGSRVRTTDLSAVVQEIVNRKGWQSGNALAFIVTGSGAAKRSVFARDAGRARAPQLSISYTLPGPTSPAPTPPPAPVPEPAPAPEPAPVVPSVSLTEWRSRVLATITNPRFNAALDPKLLAESGDLYKLGRNFNNYATGLILAYQETGDQALVQQLDNLMELAKEKLVDTNGDGYRNWLYLNETSQSSSFGTDLHEMDEILTHSVVAAVAYTFKQAGYSSSAAFWTDYLKNDFEAKWRARKNKPTGFPFLTKTLMHPYVHFIRYHFYMSKLTGDSSYYTEAKRMSEVVKRNMRPSETPGGPGYIWDHRIQLGGVASLGCQPMVYVRLTTQALADLAVVDANLFDTAFMKKVANTMAYKALLKDDGSLLAGDSCGAGSYGTVNTFAGMPYAQLAPWDDSNRLRVAAERAYAVVEKWNLASPKTPNIAAQMVFTLARQR